jgi:hypothetical protein
VTVSWVAVQFSTVPDLVDAADGDLPTIVGSSGLVLGSDTEVVECGTTVVAGSAVNVTHGVRPEPPAECP